MQQYQMATTEHQNSPFTGRQTSTGGGSSEEGSWIPPLIPDPSEPSLEQLNYTILEPLTEDISRLYSGMIYLVIYQT